MAAMNKSLAQMNKSGTAGKATKKARNPASRVDPMGCRSSRCACDQAGTFNVAAAMEPKSHVNFERLQRTGRTMAELASESSEPTVAEALRALASDYLSRAAKLHFV